jgi:hypothetical protein
MRPTSLQSLFSGLIGPALATFLFALAPSALAAVDESHVIENDRVGPFKVGMTEKEALDAALKAFSKGEVNLKGKVIELPSLKLHVAGSGAKAVVESIEVSKGGMFASSGYATREGVGPGTTEKDLRLAFRNAVRQHKINGKEGLSPEAMPGVFFQCAKEKCPVVIVRKVGK